ncbi:MAG: glycosyltransferase family 2 protein [Defluviitaleaceae bacterium]|nr:glycosyltransferase family 2 protein [Defluviitaleaceae bacterium]
MSKIYIRTVTYNNEDTIARAIESIINQTHTDWVYYICNNGSTDATGDIIEEYAKKDNRIKTFHNKENRVFTEESNGIWRFWYNFNDDEYLCTLDGDDRYSLDFMEKTLAFAKEEDLDYVVTSYNFIHPNGKKETASFKDLLVTKENFIELLQEFFLLMGAQWGKLYRGDLFRKRAILSKDFRKSLCSTDDAYFTRDTLQNSARAGFMSYIGYNHYTASKNSTFHYNLEPGALNACNIIHNKSIEMLEAKATKVNKEALNFALNKYCYQLHGVLGAILHNTTNLSNIKKVELINQVLKYKHLKQAAENKVGYLSNVLKIIYEFLGELEPRMGNFKQFQQASNNLNKMIKLAKK